MAGGTLFDPRVPTLVRTRIRIRPGNRTAYCSKINSELYERCGKLRKCPVAGHNAVGSKPASSRPASLDRMLNGANIKETKSVHPPQCFFPSAGAFLLSPVSARNQRIRTSASWTVPSPLLLVKPQTEVRSVIQPSLQLGFQ